MYPTLKIRKEVVFAQPDRHPIHSCVPNHRQLPWQPQTTTNLQKEWIKLCKKGPRIKALEYTTKNDQKQHWTHGARYRHLIPSHVGVWGQYCLFKVVVGLSYLIRTTPPNAVGDIASGRLQSCAMLAVYKSRRYWDTWSISIRFQVWGSRRCPSRLRVMNVIGYEVPVNGIACVDSFGAWCWVFVMVVLWHSVLSEEFRSIITHQYLSEVKMRLLISGHLIYVGLLFAYHQDSTFRSSATPQLHPHAPHNSIIWINWLHYDNPLQHSEQPYL